METRLRCSAVGLSTVYVTVPLGAGLAVFRRSPLAWVFSLFYFVTFGGFVAWREITGVAAA